MLLQVFSRLQAETTVLVSTLGHVRGARGGTCQPAEPVELKGSLLIQGPHRAEEDDPRRTLPRGVMPSYRSHHLSGRETRNAVY